MSKTFSITTERTVVSRVVVVGNTEEEAIENFYDDRYNYLDEEYIDSYDLEVVEIEEDIPE